MRLLSSKTATAQSYAAMTWGYSSIPSETQELPTIGGWSVIAWQEEEKDWNFYSGSWHRSYGSKITITGRFVKFISPSGKKSKTVELDSWRGNWQLKAIVAAGLVKSQKGQMNIRLNEAFEIKKFGKKSNITFYVRTLKGEIFDYCAVTPLGMTYHAESPIACIKGLKIKRAALQRKEVAVINFNFLKALGFCDTGIKEFCSIFGFSVKDSVTPDEVYDRVKANPAAAVPFLVELKTLAETIGYSVPEFN
jgi:hypothetical protein